MYIIITFALTGALLIILGVLIRECKLYNLMAGYNTMAAEKKKLYNPKPLANKVGIFLYCAGIVTAIIGVVLYFVQASKLAVIFITLGYSIIILISVIIFIIKEASGLNDI